MKIVHSLRLLALSLLLGGTMAHAADPKVTVYPEGVDTPVAITLLQRDGKVGRDNPFYDNYRPQVQFPAEREPVTCAVRVPQALEKVAPGQTADVALNCTGKFSVRQDEKSFVVFEGGRKVAVGTLK